MSGWTWGVDVATRRLAIALIENGTGRFIVEHHDWPDKLGADELLDHMFDAVWDRARDLAEVHPPATIAVEMPRWQGVPHVLTSSVSVVRQALRSTGARPWTCDPSEWKKAALGRGNVKKPLILSWAREVGSQDWCVCQGDGSRPVHERCERKVAAHDRADALGVAEAARRAFLPARVVPLPLKPLVKSVRGLAA